jgi:hypothetical protein
VDDVVIRAFLDLSTAHLDEHTCRDLNGYEHVTAYPTPYGWWMFVPDGDVADLADQGDWPAELPEIVTLARDRGCAYILFDADGPHSNLLPTFDW